MLESTVRSATLVVIEFGAAWPKWLGPSTYGDMVVVAQHYEGEPRSLVTQVASRVARLESRSWKLHAVVLVSNGRMEGDWVAARAVLARGLLANLRAAGGGELALSIDDGASRRAQQWMTALAAGLDRDAVRAGVRLGLRIGRQAPVLGLDLASKPLKKAS